MKNLEIDKKQKDLKKELELAREQEPEEVQDMVASWEKMLRLAERAEENSSQILDLAGDGSGFRSSSLQRYDRLKMEQTSLRQAIQAKYLEISLETVQLALRRVATTEYINEAETDRARYGSDKRPRSLPKNFRKTKEVNKLDTEIAQLLMELKEEPLSETTEMQELAQQLSLKSKNDGGNERGRIESRGNGTTDPDC